MQSYNSNTNTTKQRLNLRRAVLLLTATFALTACCPVALRCSPSVPYKPAVTKAMMQPAANNDLVKALRDSQKDAQPTQ